jgi:hypothetical protein
MTDNRKDFAKACKRMQKKFVTIGGELVFLVSANTTAGKTVPL